MRLVKLLFALMLFVSTSIKAQNIEWLGELKWTVQPPLRIMENNSNAYFAGAIGGNLYLEKYGLKSKRSELYKQIKLFLNVEDNSMVNMFFKENELVCFFAMDEDLFISSIDINSGEILKDKVLLIDGDKMKGLSKVSYIVKWSNYLNEFYIRQDVFHHKERLLIHNYKILDADLNFYQSWSHEFNEGFYTSLGYAPDFYLTEKGDVYHEMMLGEYLSEIGDGSQVIDASLININNAICLYNRNKGFEYKSIGVKGEFLLKGIFDDNGKEICLLGWKSAKRNTDGLMMNVRYNWFESKIYRWVIDIETGEIDQQEIFIERDFIKRLDGDQGYSDKVELQLENTFHSYEEDGSSLLFFTPDVELGLVTKACIGSLVIKVTNSGELAYIEHIELLQKRNSDGADSGRKYKGPLVVEDDQFLHFIMSEDKSNKGVDKKMMLKINGRPQVGKTEIIEVQSINKSSGERTIAYLDVDSDDFRLLTIYQPSEHSVIIGRRGKNYGIGVFRFDN